LSFPPHKGKAHHWNLGNSIFNVCSTPQKKQPPDRKGRSCELYVPKRQKIYERLTLSFNI